MSSNDRETQKTKNCFEVWIIIRCFPIFPINFSKKENYGHNSDKKLGKVTKLGLHSAKGSKDIKKKTSAVAQIGLNIKIPVIKCSKLLPLKSEFWQLYSILEKIICGKYSL